MNLTKLEALKAWKTLGKPPAKQALSLEATYAIRTAKISGDAKAWHDSIEKKLQRVKQLRETLPTLFKHGTSFRDIMAVRLVETAIRLEYNPIEDHPDLVIYIMEGKRLIGIGLNKPSYGWVRGLAQQILPSSIR